MCSAKRQKSNYIFIHYLVLQTSIVCQLTMYLLRLTYLPKLRPLLHPPFLSLPVLYLHMSSCISLYVPSSLPTCLYLCPCLFPPVPALISLAVSLPQSVHFLICQSGRGLNAVLATEAGV